MQGLVFTIDKLGQLLAQTEVMLEEEQRKNAILMERLAQLESAEESTEVTPT